MLFLQLAPLFQAAKSGAASGEGTTGSQQQDTCVNHSQHFVNPINGVYTNNIEARLAARKATIKRKVRDTASSSATVLG